MTNAPAIARTDRFVLAAQLAAFCTGLRIAVQVQATHGKVGVALLRKFREDLVRIVQGSPAAGLPTIDDDVSTVDLLLIAEALRGTIGAFLSPEEVVEIHTTRSGASN